MAGMPGAMPGGAPAAAGPLQADAPMGAGAGASPQAGLPAPQAGTPQAAQQLSQLAAQLLKKQQGTKYTQNLLKHIKTIMQKVMAASMYENPQVDSDIASIIQKLGSAHEKLGKSGPSQSPELSTSLADIVGNAGQAGATGATP